jgi:hypothetical protein
VSFRSYLEPLTKSLVRLSNAAIESPAQCSLSASGGTAGATLTATLYARSFYGALLTTQDTHNRWQVSFAYPNGSAASTSALLWQGSGSYTFTYTSTVSGAHTMMVTFAGTPISGMPLTVTITPGEAISSCYYCRFDIQTRSPFEAVGRFHDGL